MQKTRLAVLEAVRALGGQGARAEILELALRNGGFSADELAPGAPERAGAKHATFVEYRLSWELSNLKREGLLDNPERGVWRLTEAAARKPEPLIRVRVSLDRLAELRAMPQSEYLQTPEWQRTREAALERANYRCSLDRRHTNELDVHHNTFIRVGAELPGDLIVLCASCHERHHLRAGGPARPAVAGEAPEPGEAVEASSFGPPVTVAPAPAGRPSPANQPVDAPTDRSLLRRIFSRA